MKHARIIVLFLALLVLYGCVSLTGQRFTWFHDVVKDTFYILIQYDGIHEGRGGNKLGKDQIPKFIADRDIMILDWIGHIQRDDLDRMKAKKDPVESAAARPLLLGSISQLVQNLIKGKARRLLARWILNKCFQKLAYIRLSRHKKKSSIDQPVVIGVRCNLCTFIRITPQVEYQWNTQWDKWLKPRLQSGLHSLFKKNKFPIIIS